jgi:hypothetical protein
MAFVKPTPEAMREEFHRLVAARDAVVAKSAPKRAAYDAKRAEISQIEEIELKPLAVAMKEAEAPLFELNRDIAQMSSWLKGVTGAPPDSDA